MKNQGLNKRSDKLSLFLLEDSRRLLPLSEPFIRKWDKITSDEYQALIRDALAEMQAPGFVTTWPFKTA